MTECTTKYNEAELKERTDGDLRAMMWNLSLELNTLSNRLTAVSAELNRRNSWK